MTTTTRFWFHRWCGALLILALVAPATMATAQDDMDTATMAEAPSDAGSAVSGSLNLDFNTHFMSYGFNVWGRSEFEDIIFNPSFGLDFDLGNGFTAFIGTWWDVNNNGPEQQGVPIQAAGKSIKEVDVWVGGSYAYDIFSVSLTYQEWYYANDEERIFDIGLGLDTILAPTLTIHNRVDGNNGQDTGAVFVIGASHGLDVGPVSLGASADLAFVTEDFYQQNQGGFGYVRAGVSGSVPISFIPAALGDWSLHAGLDYYYTDSKNVDNPHNSILTGNAGITLAF